MDWDGATLQMFGTRMGLFALPILMFHLWSWEQPLSPGSGSAGPTVPRSPSQLPVPPGCSEPSVRQLGNAVPEEEKATY